MLLVRCLASLLALCCRGGIRLLRRALFLQQLGLVIFGLPKHGDFPFSSTKDVCVDFALKLSFVFLLKKFGSLLVFFKLFLNLGLVEVISLLLFDSFVFSLDDQLHFLNVVLKFLFDFLNF